MGIEEKTVGGLTFNEALDQIGRRKHLSQDGEVDEYYDLVPPEEQTEWYKRAEKVTIDLVSRIYGKFGGAYFGENDFDVDEGIWYVGDGVVSEDTFDAVFHDDTEWVKTSFLMSENTLRSDARIGTYILFGKFDDDFWDITGEDLDSVFWSTSPGPDEDDD
jgi:hypothetical protein